MCYEVTTPGYLSAVIFWRCHSLGSSAYDATMDTDNVVLSVADVTISSKDGLDAMLENGPWFIRNNTLILKKWDSDVNLLKEDIGNVLVWVKLHDVRMTAFSEDGLSVIATKLGTPFMFDSYTSDMCMQSLGRLSYARVMIELRADVELKDTIVVAMPKLLVFGHVLNECPNKIVSDVVKNLNNPRQATRGVPVGPKGNVDNDSKVEVVFDETANLMASTSFKCGSDRGHGTNSLLEKWTKTKRDDDYDPYDDDLYESHDMSDHFQAICDYLNITVRGRKKKEIIFYVC
ncbi:copia protein [Tanacetum coccineum]